MKPCYCAALKRKVSLLFSSGPFCVRLTFPKTGEVFGTATIPYPFRRNYCAFVDSKTFPWLPCFLVENGLAIPTHRCLIKDNFVYEEFHFLKEE